MKRQFSKVIAFLLCLSMLICAVPFSALAAVEYDEIAESDYYKLISQKDWELAPGIVESEIVLNNDAGDRRQVLHVVEVDMDNPYTKVIPSAKGMTPTPGSYGVQTMDLQAAYAEANGYGNVVAAMNISLSWYDSAYYDARPELVGEPLGYMILDGVQYTNSQGKTAGAQTCLVINFDEKDGVARPADMPKVVIRSTADAITGWEEQVIPANFGFLVKDGKMVNSTEEHTSEGASRSMLGVKADGSIIMVMNDGRQAPYSTGLNNYEMSEAMLKLGCVYAINGDGGGSSQFLSQRPGEELSVNCSPSDGALRATTHGVLVISTAPSTGEFVRAHVEAEHEYYTPNSTVQFTAVGTDLVGTPAEIPAEASWQLADESYGAIDSNGLFTSNGKQGEVIAQLTYNGEVKGSASIHIVTPDAISFGTAAAYTVPFGESVNILVSATYGVFDVALKASDYTITFSDTTLGSLTGNTYTAGNTWGSTDMTVTLNADASVTKTIPLTVGKGSEVVFSFEEGTIGADLSNWQIKDHEGKYTPYSDISIVTAENGMVHNGTSALAVHMPTHQHVDGGEGYNANSITWIGDPILLENATAIGMWVYIPEEATQTEIALNYVWYNDQGVQQRTTPDLCLNDYFNDIEASGWYYLSVPISKTKAYIEDATAVATAQGYKRNFFLKFYVTNSGNAGDESSYSGDITYYIDDVTVDYSSAVADRENPTINATYVKNISTDTDVTLSAAATANLSSGAVSFIAEVTDNLAVDADSTYVYVDGKAVATTFKNGRVTSEDVVLGAGVHRVEYAVADISGNVSKAVRYFCVSGTDVAVNVVAHDADQTTALTGSVYWVDVVANNAEKISKVTLKLDLDTMHSWELAYAELAENYAIEYYYASVADKNDNVITVVLTNNGSNATGNAAIASLPVRVWSYCGNATSSSITPAEAWTKGFITAVSVNVEVEYGQVVYTDNTSTTFSAKKLHADTEAYIHQYKMDKTYFANNTYHVHTETALEDKAATCTENGYSGRTFCEVCNSVVDWGIVVPATGHSFTVEADGLYICSVCGDAFYYVDGKVQTGWQTIDGNTYYFNAAGVAADGEYTVDGKTYTFTNYILTKGAWEHDDVGLTCYWAGQQVSGGWNTMNGQKYFFTGIYANVGIAKVAISTDIGYKWYVFDANGVWLEDLNGFYRACDGDACFAENGIATYAGVVQDAEGNFYYINSTCKAVKNCKYGISEGKANGLIPAGTYEFDAEGKMINAPSQEPDEPERPDEPTVKNGLVKDEDGEIRYYVDGVAQYAGVVQDSEGNLYYINSTKKAVKSCKYGISAAKTNGLIEAGIYEFDAEGKMINAPSQVPDEPEQPDEPTVKNGLVKDEDGEIRYYVDGVAQYAGVVQDSEGNLYYINSTKKAVKSCKYGISAAKTNGLIEAGIYEFGADGKMIIS